MAHILEGVIIANKMKNTVTVRVENTMRHPTYRKVITRHRKFKAHVEGMELQTGDRVEIKEVRPLSKTVHFQVTKKI